MPPCANADNAADDDWEGKVGDALMFVIQYLPIDFPSLQALLSLSKRLNEHLRCNTLMWVALACRASRGCQACFLEARAGAGPSGLPGAQYWRDTARVLLAAGALRQQWGLRTAHRTFVNTGE